MRSPRRMVAMLCTAAASAVLLSDVPVRSYCTLPSPWRTGTVTMSYDFPPSGLLSNGTTSWSANVESAMDEWSSVSEDFRFVKGGSGGTGSSGADRVSNMVFGAGLAGNVFGDDILALTLTRTDFEGFALESDIVFNEDVQWGAYDGPLRADADGNPVFDFRRIALHELGHALGLDHPDEACDQSVVAVMNARTSAIDRLTIDDRNGLSFIYADGNQPPIAVAGPDQFGDGVQPFVLNGGGSHDADGFIALFEWRLDDEIVARGRVDEISLRRGTYIIEMTVTDDKGASATDTLNITVGSEFSPPQPGNEFPIADAGGDRRVTPGSLVILDATASIDPDGELVRYVWSESSRILGRDPVINVVLAAGVHAITLTVFDNSGDANSNSIIVIVAADDALVDRGPLLEPPSETHPPQESDPPGDPQATSDLPCGSMGLSLALLPAALLAHHGSARRRVHFS